MNLVKGTKLRKAASDVKIDIKLSNIKPIHASWIVAAFQQVTKTTLIRGWEKTCIKECVDNCDYDYHNYLFHIYSMISHFDAHCDFNMLFLLLTLSVPVTMAVFFVILTWSVGLKTINIIELSGYTGDNRINNKNEIPENTSTLHKNTNN